VGPDRTTLVTMRSETRAGIWVGDGTAANGADVVAPAPFSGRARLARVAWVGDNLLYGSTASGRAIVARLYAALGMPEELVSNALEGSGTSDGRTIVYRATEADREGLWKVNADGRRPEQLVPGQIRGPLVFPNGRFIVSSRVAAVRCHPGSSRSTVASRCRSRRHSPQREASTYRQTAKRLYSRRPTINGDPLRLYATCPPARRAEACLFCPGECGGHLTVTDLPTMTLRLATSGFNPSTDRPLDVWGEDFLPEMLQRTLRQIRRGDHPL
jgi:hypothetical protein